MKNLYILFLVIGFQSAIAQVGINTTTPNASLDITASDPVNPSPDDGLLIPRINEFPATNPGADQQGMLVYLTQIDGSNQPGFYSWDTITTSWKSFGLDSGTKYYSAIGVTNAQTSTNFIPMPEMDLTFTPLSNTVFVNFSAHGFPTINSCQEQPVFFQLLVNNIPSNRWQSTTEVLLGGALRPVWNSNITLPVSVVSGVQNTISVVWKSFNCVNGNLVSTPFSQGANTISASRYLLVMDPNGGGGVAGSTPSISEFWSFSGNAGINTATDFIGTVDNSDFIIKRNNEPSGWLHVSNTSFGRGALQNYGGVSNTAIGTFSLRSTLSGAGNTSIGYSALNLLSSGNENVAIGQNAGFRVNGDQNVFVGYNAGRSSPISLLKSGSVNIGYEAGALEEDSNTLYIENSNADENNALVYGEFDTDIFRINGSFQIGNPLIDGFSFPDVDGATSQILQTDGNGSLTWTNNNSSSAYWNRTGSILELTNATDDINFTSDQTSLFFPTTTGNPSSIIYLFNAGTNNSDRMIFSQSPAFSTWGLMYRDTTDSFRFLSGGNDRVVVNLQTGVNPLVVTGTAQATAFQSATTTYPDYVFEDYFEGTSKINPTYKFKTLEEHFEFIKNNGHLQGVKSYKEIAADGMQFNLTETAIQNLEKIEELFIYAYELQQENITLKETQEALIKRLEKLEQLINN